MFLIQNCLSCRSLGNLYAINIILESLPPGFRFDPTDEVLVNYYLKRKITGVVRSEQEAIPEIAVNKFEPWELPGKSLEMSDSPVWFFFAPTDKDMRVNRATEKGYWKPTGKNRSICCKDLSGQVAVIGMKKTLVFYKGQAPHGLRTNWIMHEYRTINSTSDLSQQGNYVLCKLRLKVHDDLGSFSTLSLSHASLAGSCSSLSETQHHGEVLQEITASMDSKLALQAESLNLPSSVATQKVGAVETLDSRLYDKQANQGATTFSIAPGVLQNKGRVGWRKQVPHILLLWKPFEFQQAVQILRNQIN